MYKGNLGGRLLIIQDESSRDDLEQGVPFTGPAGWRLKGWLQDSGIDLNDVVFTDEFDKHHCMPNIEVIVPTGEKSLAFFLPKSPKLAKLRGSIYNIYDSLGDRHIKLTPTLHPKEVQFNTQWEYRCRSDWRKIKEQIENAGLFNAPERNHNITPGLNDIKAFYQGLRPESITSIDIETWGGSLKCVGFSTDERTSLVVPTENHYWKKQTGDELDLHNAMDWIQKICEHPCAKVMQNGLFDAWWLKEYDITVNNYVWDTLAMHHALWPRDNHSLDYLASIYTNQPYWKDEAKEADEIVKVAKQGMDKLYVYNGLDVTVTHEIFQRLHEELSAAGMLEFYHVQYAEIYESLLSMMRRGVRVDSLGMAAMRTELVADALRLRDEASTLIGVPLYTFDKTGAERAMLELYQQGITDYAQILERMTTSGHKEETIERKWTEHQAKGISDTILKKFVGEMGLPKSATGVTSSGAIKADNIGLRKIQKYYEERKTDSAEGKLIISLVDIVLEHRRKKKLATFLTESKIDEDSRLRCTYKVSTKTGRLSSSSNPRGTGMNLQNIDRSLRKMYVASPGRILLEMDLSRAENRVVGVLTGDEEMIAAARRPTTGVDVYKERTAGIYSVLQQKEVTIDDVTDEMRRLGKEVVLAVPYGMQGGKFADNLLKKLGMTLTPAEAQRLLNADLEKQPAIRRWQSEVRKAIMRDKYLTNSWGFSIDFLYDRMDDNTYRFAYAFLPQGEIGRLANQWMVKPVYQAIKEHNLKSELILQCHDAIIIDAVPEEVWHLMRYTQRCVERPRVYGACLGREVELVIPTTFAIGTTWAKAMEFKTLPTKEELTDKIKELLK